MRDSPVKRRLVKTVRALPIRQSICGLAAVLALLTAAPALARIVPWRDPREGVFDASLVVLVRQVKWDEFRIEETFFGDKPAGPTLLLPKLRLFIQQQYGPDIVEAITPATRILLFLRPKDDVADAEDQRRLEIPTYGDWQIADWGNCFF